MRKALELAKWREGTDPWPPLRALEAEARALLTEQERWRNVRTTAVSLWRAAGAVTFLVTLRPDANRRQPAGRGPRRSECHKG